MNFGKQIPDLRKQKDVRNLFNKTQELSDDQKKTVMDLLSAFLLKSNLKQQLG